MKHLIYKEDKIMKRLANVDIITKAHNIADQIMEFLDEGDFLIIDDGVRQGYLYNEQDDCDFCAITMSFTLKKYHAYDVSISEKFYRFIDNLNASNEHSIINIKSNNVGGYTIFIRVYEE